MASQDIITPVQYWIIASVIPLLFGIAVAPIAIFWALYCMFMLYTHVLAVQWLPAKGKLVYITGCDSGFGFESARVLHDKGCDVVAGCLDLASDGARELRKREPNRMLVVKLDVSSQVDVDKVAEQIEALIKKKQYDGLWGIYNNAGIALASEIELTPMSNYEKSINVNLLGVIRVTKSVLHLIRRAKGRVVTISSGLSVHGLHSRSGYSAPKAAVEMFMNILRYEMRKFGVKVSIIHPGGFMAATKVFVNLNRHLDTVEEKLSENVLQDYGKGYFAEWREKCIGAYNATSVGAPHEPVTSAVVAGLLSKYPMARYTPGWFVLVGCGFKS